MYDEASFEDWETILQLSHRWIFPEVKSLAIRELQKQTMTPVKRIVLYHNFEVDRNLLIPEYAALCEREHPLTLEEGLELGMETTLMVAWGREAARSKRLEDGALSTLGPTLHWEEILGMVRDIFKIPPHPVEGTATPMDNGVNGLNSGAPVSDINYQSIQLTDFISGLANPDNDDEAQSNQENDTGSTAEEGQGNKGRKSKGNKGKAKGNADADANEADGSKDTPNKSARAKNKKH